MSGTRDYAAEYKAARYEKHTASDLAGQLSAEKLARSVDRAADRAGIYLDVITLDEQARLESLGTVS